jgi:hypothetical protein
MVALSLAHLGDARVLSFLREQLDCGDPQQVFNAVSALRFLGELEDINRLRAIHRSTFGSGGFTRKIRNAAVSAILAILDEDGGHSADRILDQIRGSFADRALKISLLIQNIPTKCQKTKYLVLPAVHRHVTINISGVALSRD